MAYDFDKTIKVGKWEVKVDTKAKYGYFEHDEEGEGGGLWFENYNDDGGIYTLEISDYDGVSELPKSVVESLIQLGFMVSESFQ